MSGQSDVVAMCVGIVCCFPRSIWSHQTLAVRRRSVAICGHARGIFPALTRCVAFLRAWRCLPVLMAQVKVHAAAWTIWSWHQWQWPSAKAFGQLLRRYSRVSRSYQDMKVTWTWQGIINCLPQHVVCWIIASQDCQHILHSGNSLLQELRWRWNTEIMNYQVNCCRWCSFKVQIFMLTWQNEKIYIIFC